MVSLRCIISWNLTRIQETDLDYSMQRLERWNLWCTWEEMKHLERTLWMYWHNLEGPDANVVDMVLQECLTNTSPNRYLLTEARNMTHSNMSNACPPIASNTTINGCKEPCLHDCSCNAVVFSYGKDISDGNCFMPSEIFSTGENTRNQSQSLTFIKELNTVVASSPSPAGEDIPVAPLPTLPSRHRKKLTATISASAAGAFIVFLLIIAILVLLRKKILENKFEDDMKQVPGMLLGFLLKELESATENFKEMLGSGGFGSVFKGKLADGTRIAVKWLDKMSQGMREFVAEVETIGSLHHFNLVRLVGFCAEKTCRLLVYEHMTNGSLDNWIFNGDQEHYLPWQTRKKIILDIAKGLAYLHEDCRQKIIHFDIKLHNILLDENFNAKVSDFSLSTLINRDENQILTTMRGTPGYLAPEWRELRVTVKVDVYSFRIVLLEIVCKRRNVESSRSESNFHLPKLLQKKAEEDQLIDIVEGLDEDMVNNKEEVVRMIRIGAWCLQNDPAERPFMSTVVKVLEGVMEIDPNISYKFSHASASSPVSNHHVTTVPEASILSAPRKIA